jgi:hypothetical protein
MRAGCQLQRGAALLLSAAVGLAGMLVSQPDQGSLRGRFAAGATLLLHRGEGQCLHLHHWMVCGALCLVVVLALAISGGQFTPAVLVLLGLLLGAAASDGVYGDLSLRRHCAVCLRPSRPKDWASCERACQGT